jgi:hypothetical protein
MLHHDPGWRCGGVAGSPSRIVAGNGMIPPCPYPFHWVGVSPDLDFTTAAGMTLG